MRHAVAMVVVSAGAMVVEIVAARMLAPLVGMTVFSWTAVIATVLAGLSAGHWIGGIVADREPARLGARLFQMLIATAVLTTTPILLVAPVHAGAETLGLGWMAATVTVAGVCFTMPSLLAGAVTPVLTAAAVAGAPGRTGLVIGRMFALGAAGAILGTMLAGFVLLQWVGSIGSLAVVAAAEALVAALFLRDLRVPVVGALVVAGVLAGSGAPLLAAPYCRVESRYYCLDLVDTTAWAGFPSRGMFLDGWVQSVEPTDGTDRLAIEAHAFLDAWARRSHGPDDAWRAFFIGGGGYSLPTRWVARWPQVEAVVAEIDPAVTAFAAEIGFRQASGRIRVRDEDARSVLRRDAARYDLVFSDAFSGHTMPAHLVTVEFHRLVRDRLEPGGVYAINAYDWARDPRFLAAMLRSLRQVFVEVTVWRSDTGPVRPGRRTPYILLASQGALDPAPVTEAGGGRSWTVRPAPPATADAPVLTDDYAPVDRLTLR
ncbi:fused MFS/spermidine synthase [Thalassobaculum sp.]|uniref:fused MFS/spermidine synthase n=1 Tax=Thalassobaculum sp. TaxID=2022740 RepID=UPI0032EE4DF3